MQYRLQFELKFQVLIVKNQWIIVYCAVVAVAK